MDRNDHLVAGEMGGVGRRPTTGFQNEEIPDHLPSANQGAIPVVVRLVDGELGEHFRPAEARLAPNVDLPTLAKRYRLTGGSIVNICVGAASLAYAPGGAIEMKHLLLATKRELQKLGEQYRDEDFSPELTVVVGGRGRSGA